MQQSGEGGCESNAKACAPCREAHQACDKGRPCGRCCHLDRSHLCCDPAPPLRKRGRPSKRYPPRSHISPPPPPQSQLTSTFPLQCAPLCSASASAFSPFCSASSPSFASSSSPRCTSPFPEELTQPPSFFSSTSSSFCSSPASFSVILEQEEALPLPAHYCHGCGTEFVLQEAAFCMSCGMRRALFRGENENNLLQNQTSSTSKTTETQSCVSQYHTNDNRCNGGSTTQTGEEPHLSTSNANAGSSLYVESASSCSSSFSSSPALFNNNKNKNKNNNGIIKLWLPPMMTVRMLSCSSKPLLPNAYMLDCFVDDQLTEPWAFIRILAQGSSIVAVNSAFLRFSGYSQDELLGRCYKSLIPEQLMGQKQTRFDKLMSRLGDIRDCQVVLHNPVTLATKDGTWLLSHAHTTLYFSTDADGPLCISVQLKDAAPVQKSVAIEWSKRDSDGLETLRVSPRSAVALPEDARFHEGSFFSSPPIASLASMREEKENEELLAVDATHFSSSSGYPPRVTSPVLSSTRLDPSYASCCATTSLLELLTSPAFDCGDTASFWSDMSDASLHNFSMENLAQEYRTEVVSFNDIHSSIGNSFIAPFG